MQNPTIALNRQSASLLDGKEITPVADVQPTRRVGSIDILRALVMLLMIFVNDLGSLHDIPGWLEHVPKGADGMGLADSVFPAFLFIVGLSLPFAVDNRRKKGDTEWQLVKHVLVRSFALLVMGVFFVDGETLNSAAMGIPRYLYNPLCCICFILIWNLYPKTINRNLVYVLKGLGIAGLVALAIAYRGSFQGHIGRFQPSWWGILGLIGWSYLAAGLITVVAKNRFSVIIPAWIFFCVLSMAAKAGYLPLFIKRSIPGSISGGTLVGLSMGGVLTALIFQYYWKQGKVKTLSLVYLGLSALLIAASVITRPYWKLAKLGATPAWLYLCSAFTILGFLAMIWVVDVFGKGKWFSIIKPAGTDTLLCYLMPYFMLSIMTVTSFDFPNSLLGGGIGLLKCFLFALFCIFLAGRLNKIGVRLKL